MGRIITTTGIVTVLFFITSTLDGILTSEIREYCRWESLNTTCESDEIVVMDTARYGRMRVGRCIERDYYTGCAGDVLLYTDERCSGRRECQIRVPDSELHEIQPCPKDIIGYLEASYSCVKVASPKPGSSCHSNTPNILKGSSGIIASAVTDESGFGTQYCPWHIEVKPGQKVNISLYDFSVLTNSGGNSRLCQMYATIKEPTKNRDVNVCGGTSRVRHVMTSESNEVKIAIVSQPKVTAYFMLKYEAIGCPDLKAPANSWMERDGDSVVIGCNDSDEKWHLVCKGTGWIGEYKNCTKAKDSWTLSHVLGSNPTFPYGLLISVAIGVILGVLLGSLMLSLVIVYRRRRKREEEMKRLDLLARQNIKQGDYDTERKYSQDYLEDFDTKSTFAHIWELRQGTQYQQSSYVDVDNAPKQPSQDTLESMSQARTLTLPGRHQKEHVYESPQLSRRESENNMTPLHEGAIPYYHEFDPQNGDSVSGLPRPAGVHCYHGAFHDGMNDFNTGL